MKKYAVATLVVCASFVSAVFPVGAFTSSPVYLEDMTWMEIRDSVQAGKTIAIVPTGGTEQNGPHMVVGKHNIIVRHTAGEIAKRLGNALVTPVIPFTPSGRITPPEGHMQFAGTISLSHEAFALMLQDVASSLKQHGFRIICFIGDHGGSQEQQNKVAARLSELWRSEGVRVINVSDYYNNNGQDRWTQSIGLKVPNPGAHAGLQDTSELLELYSQGVRNEQRNVYTERDYRTTGAMGDSTQASANYGRQFLQLKIDAAVNQISHVARHSK